MFCRGNIGKPEKKEEKWNKQTRKLGVLHEIFWADMTKLRNQINEYIESLP
jgi:hypothetical protein